MVDTGSQVTIVNNEVYVKEIKPENWVRGISGAPIPAQKIPIVIYVYNREPLQADIMKMNVECCVLGMDLLQDIVGEWLPLKQLKGICAVISIVKIDPVVLPRIPASFTKQYPIKGGHDEITEALRELEDQGVVERTQSFNYNSPVWPVKKPNGKWRFTVDYRNINKLSPQMPGNLPEVESIFSGIKQLAPEWYAAVDLSDMFFCIPLAEESREITTFTWDACQYRFTRLPQGYRNSPIIAHATLRQTIPWDSFPKSVRVFSYVDDLLVCGKDKSEVDSTIKQLVTLLQQAGWTLNPDKIQGPSQQVKFLGVLWSSVGPSIPDKVMDILTHIEEPKTKQQAQHIIGLFGYWKNHIPYLQILLAPMYKVTRKAQDFVWGKEQQDAFHTALSYMKLYAQLYILQPDEEFVIDILFVKDYASWGMFIKRSGKTLPIGFRCKRFPYAPNKYSLFEKYVWATYSALQGNWQRQEE